MLLMVGLGSRVKSWDSCWPHLLATLTIRTTLPLYSFKDTSCPSIFCTWPTQTKHPCQQHPSGYKHPLCKSLYISVNICISRLPALSSSPGHIKTYLEVVDTVTLHFLPSWLKCITSIVTPDFTESSNKFQTISPPSIVTFCPFMFQREDSPGTWLWGQALLPPPPIPTPGQPLECRIEIRSLTNTPIPEFEGISPHELWSGWSNTCKNLFAT